MNTYSPFRAVGPGPAAPCEPEDLLLGTVAVDALGAVGVEAATRPHHGGEQRVAGRERLG